MVGYRYPGPLGCDTNQPEIDKAQPGPLGAEWRRPEPVSQLQAAWERERELGKAGNLLVWWLIGSPGDQEFGPGDEETKHMRNTSAYREAVEIYRNWLQNGRPAGKFNFTIPGTHPPAGWAGINCEWVPSKGYFYVAGRSPGIGPSGYWTEGLEHPLWGYTGNFSIRFTESGWPSAGHVDVELENYTSLPSFLHNLMPHLPEFLDNLYTKSPGWPIVSRSRQIYRFRDYILSTKVEQEPTSKAPTQSNTDSPHTVVAGDSLSTLAQARYGDMSLWPIIWKANPDTIDPNRIQVGQSLVIPPKASLTTEQISDAKRTAQLWYHVGSVKITPLR